MEYEITNAVRVTPSTRIRFKCTGCAECCRHVKQTVPVDSRDAFQITKYLIESGEEISCTDQFLVQYAEPAMINECGYFVYFLKTVGPDDDCIFLKDNRCAIHAAKPRACRVYPFMVEPTASGEHGYLYSLERTHHYRGPVVETRSWMKKHFPKEDRVFLQADYSKAPLIVSLLKRIPEERRTTAAIHFHRFLYSGYDLDKPFLEQYLRNQEKLLEVLSEMAD